MHPNATRFNARDDAPAQHCRYCLMDVVQGFMQSHCTTSSVKYWDCIALNGWRGHMQKKKTKKYHTCRLFCSPWRCAGTRPSALPDGGGPGLSRKPLVDASRQVLRPIVGHRTFISVFFSSFFIVGWLKRWLR